MKINIMLLGCFLSVAIANAQGPSAIDNNTKQPITETKATTGKYTGYWYIKSGDEFYLVRSGNLPPGLIKKTTDNKVEDIDVETVKRAVNFRKESNINGKPVDNYYFVIEEGEGEGNTASLATEAIYSGKNYNNSLTEINAEGMNVTPLNYKSDNNTTDAVYTLTPAACGYNNADDKISAILVCYGELVPNWGRYNPCITAITAGNVCIAYHNSGTVVYYVVCGS